MVVSGKQPDFDHQVRDPKAPTTSFRRRRADYANGIKGLWELVAGRQQLHLSPNPFPTMRCPNGFRTPGR